MIIVVVDTSVYVSALVFGGVPRTALEKALKSPYQLAVSHEIREELVQTLQQNLVGQKLALSGRVRCFGQRRSGTYRVR